MSKTKTITALALHCGGITLGRHPLKRIKDGDMNVGPLGAEMAVDLKTLGPGGQELFEENVIAAGLCYAPVFHLTCDGVETTIFGKGGTDQNPNPGYKVEEGAPEGFGIGDSRWISTRGYGFIVNQLAGHEAPKIITIWAEIPELGIRTNTLGLEWRDIKAQERGE